MKLESTLENKAKFFAQYFGVKCMSIRKEQEPVLYVGFDDFVPKEQLEKYYLNLTPLSQITDEDAIEVARIVHGESDNFAIDFNANGCTSVSPYGLPCYADTIDINWNGGIYYDRSSSNVDIIYAFQYLQSKGYALPYMGLSIEDLVFYQWINLTSQGAGGKNYLIF